MDWVWIATGIALGVTAGAVSLVYYPPLPLRLIKRIAEPAPQPAEDAFGWGSLSTEEQQRIEDFAWRGAGRIEDVYPLLQRLPIQMMLSFRQGHDRVIKERRLEMESYRAGLRWRAKEARSDRRRPKCTPPE